MKDLKIIHLGENLSLHPYKSIYWERRKILLLADVHLGKAAHFRKSGIPVPENIHEFDLKRIEFLVKFYNPQRIIFLGDLFHSSYNKAWKTFSKFCLERLGIGPELIPGNHDILEKGHYDFIQIHDDNLLLHPFILSHKPLNNKELDGYYNLCGHIHPSVKISGPAKQSLRVECFYFSNYHGVLPAFGNFTGTSKMPAQGSSDKVYAVTNQKIIHLF